MLPEWIWVMLVGSCLLGLIGYIWSTRNQGFLTETRHIELCNKRIEGVSMDIEKLSETFRDSLMMQTKGIHDLLNAKFEGLDEKIENKILREIRLLNGHSKRKPSARKNHKKS